MSSSQIIFLVPLNRNLEEDSSTPKLTISAGANIIGRHSVSISDKRLSRKHLTLIASRNGSADAVVEGTNPVVVASGNRRRKLRTGEKAIITNGDILELIPGHYFFKYVNLAGQKCEKKGNSEDALNTEPNEASLSRKRMRQVTEDEAFARKLRAEMESDALVEERSLVTGKSGCSQASTASIPSAHKDAEAIRQFSVPNDKLPLTFRLLRVKDLPAWANTSSVSIRDVIQGDVLIAVLSNYMVDIDWLLSSCPALAKIPHVLVIHGEGDGTLDHMMKSKPPNWILHKPPLPISFGTHHSKAMLLVYPRGVRVIVHTANLIYVDWNNKSQGLWMQDFPWKIQKELSKGCAFENDLIDYLSVLKYFMRTKDSLDVLSQWPEFTANLPALGSFNINSSFFRKFNYNNAVVRLIASVPGYHTGSNLKKWGHMKLRSVLQECIFDKEFQKSPLAYQFSSLGSLDVKWMTELASSMSSGSCDDKTPLGLSKPLIIWPTVEDVRCSLEGYAAGNAIPSPQKNVEKEFLKQYWAKWKATHTGRCVAMPHIKTYTRYNGQNLAWFLLTSANLSKAAWGALQKNNSQLMIRSYELGVLFLPSPANRHGGFSCTDSGSPKNECGLSEEESKSKRTKLVTLNWEGNRSSDSSSEVVVVPLPVPYELPPKPYASEDVPWSWDRRYYKKDVYGHVWPRHVRLCSSPDS